MVNYIQPPCQVYEMFSWSKHDEKESREQQIELQIERTRWKTGDKQVKKRRSPTQAVTVRFRKAVKKEMQHDRRFYI